MAGQLLDRNVPMPQIMTRVMTRVSIWLEVEYANYFKEQTEDSHASCIP